MIKPVHNIGRYKLPLMKPVLNVNNLRVRQELPVTHRTDNFLRISMRIEKNITKLE